MVTPTLRVQEKVYLMAIKKPHWELLFTSYHLNAQTLGQEFSTRLFSKRKQNCQPLEQSRRSLEKVFFCEDVNMQSSRAEDH